MPIPPAATVENLTKGALSSAGLRGEHVDKLATAFGDTLAKSFNLFVSTTTILPGVAAAAPPPGLSGSTVGPGSFLPPTAPTAADIEGLAQVGLTSTGLHGQHIGALAKVFGQLIAAAGQQFFSQQKLAPGVAIAAGITTAPGFLLGPPANKPALEAVALAALDQGNLKGEASPKLAGALAQVTATALDMLAASVQVAPGIPSTPAATSGPGRLL